MTARDPASRTIVCVRVVSPEFLFQSFRLENSLVL